MQELKATESYVCNLRSPCYACYGKNLQTTSNHINSIAGHAESDLSMDQHFIFVDKDSTDHRMNFKIISCEHHDLLPN
jgi:hypothetical protein